MALQVWLPLNGNLNNQGVENPTISQSTTPTYTDGKIGKCLTLSNSYYTIPYTNIGTEMSICFWVKPNSTSSWTDIISFGGNSRIEKSSTLLYYFYADSNSLTTSGTQLFQLTDSVWYHIAMTVDGTNVKFYVNGTLTKTIAQSNQLSTVFTTNQFIRIGNRTTVVGYYSGYLNDFRVYNNCLSQEEVHEISQGLVLHYPLDNPYNANITNLLTDQMSLGYFPSIVSGTTRTAKEGYYNYKINRTRSGTSDTTYNTLAGANASSWTAGNTYLFYCKFRLNSYSNLRGFYFRPSRVYNDWTTSYINVLNYTQGKWYEVYKIMTVPATFTRNGSTITSTGPKIEFWIYDTLTDGVTVTADYDIKDMMILESSVKLPFIRNGFKSSIVQDCSGYGNNGTATNLSLNTDSPRYDCSTLFSSSYISKIPDVLNANVDAFTISLWFYSTSISSTQCLWNGRTTVGYSFAIFIVNSKIRFDTGNSNTYQLLSNTTLSSNKWYHLVCVWSSGYAKIIYINNSVDGTTTNYGTPSKSNSFATIGTSSYADGTPSSNPMIGSISDFRIYRTALISTDVKKLYECGASIDKLGNIHAYEFNETSSENLMSVIENRLVTDKAFGYGLQSYTQTNCQVTITDNGMRIYRPANKTVSADGNTMWGGMKLMPASQGLGDVLVKGHTYIIKWHVKGQTSGAATSTGWSNNMGWGGGGLMPSPSNVTYKYPPANFEGEMNCFYRFTINDEVYKECTSSYSSFVAGTTYLSYRDFMMGWGYASTGTLGTDIYVTDIRMYDITTTEQEIKVEKCGIVDCGYAYEDSTTASFCKDTEILINELKEI